KTVTSFPSIPSAECCAKPASAWSRSGPIPKAGSVRFWPGCPDQIGRSDYWFIGPPEVRSPDGPLVLSGADFLVLRTPGNYPLTEASMRKLMLFILVTIAGSAAQTFPDTAELSRMAARFAPTPLTVDTSSLSAGDKQALVKLIQAARAVNTIFMRQLWSG